MTEEQKSPPAGNGVQPGMQPMQVNLAVTKTLRALLTQAERGLLSSIIVVGADPAGNQLEGYVVIDNQLALLNIRLDIAKAKVVGRMMQFDQQPQKPSPIIQPAGAAQVKPT